MTTTDEFLARLVNLENEAVQASSSTEFWTFLVFHRDVPTVLTVQKTVEIPQVSAVCG